MTGLNPDSWAHDTITRRWSEIAQRIKVENALSLDIEARIDASRRRPSLHEVPVHAGGRVWTVGSLAAARGVSERYVRKLIAEGKLFARKTAAGYEIPDALALEFLARPKS